MRNSLFHRILSFALAFALILSVMPAPAYAAEQDEQKDQQSETTQVEVTFNLENSKVLTPEGEEIQLPYMAEPGSSLSFMVAPVDGYELESVKIGGNTIIADAEDVLTVTVKEGLTISVTSTPKIVTVPVTLVNSKILTPEGEEIPLPIEMAVGSTLSFMVAPLDGYELESVQIDTNTFYADTEDVFNLTIREGRTITVKAKDGTAPVVSVPVRQESGWTATATYTFTAEDNIAVDSVTIANDADPSATTDLVAAADSTYTATITENGTYTIVVLDTAGNRSEVTFTEAEVDSLAPEIQNFQRHTDEWTAFARYTFDIVETGSGLASAIQQINGGEETEIVLRPDGKYVVVLQEPGEVVLTLTDNAGNVTTKTFSDDKIDNIPPAVEELTRQENGWSHSATYTFKVSDSGTGVYEVYAGSPKGSPAVPDENGYYSFTVTINGEYSVTVSDNAGNSNRVNIREEKIDNDAPVISEVTRQESGWAAGATYTFTVEDPLSGVVSVTVQLGEGQSTTLTPDENGVYTFVAEDNGTYTITAKDALDNTATQTVAESEVDMTAPEILNFQRHTDDWAAFGRYTFNVADAQSGIVSVTAQFAGGEIQTLELRPDGKYGVIFDENGECTITVTDGVGNITVKHITETLVDTIPPAVIELTRVEDGWSHTATYTFKVAEAESGVYQVVVGSAKNPPSEPDANGVYTFTTDRNGSFIIDLYDNAGNGDRIEFEETQIDNDAPVISNLTRTEDAWTPMATYSFTAEDPLSGVKEVTVQIDAETPVVMTPDADGVYRFTAEKNCTYTVTAKDAIDNTSTKAVTEDQVDFTAPEIATPIREHSGWATASGYTFQVSDDLAGVKEVTVTLNGSTTMLTADANGDYRIPVAENGVYTITAVDLAGNTATVEITEDRIDTTAPAFVDFGREESGWATSATYTFSVEETQSGVSSVTVQMGTEAPVALTPDADGLYSFNTAVNGEYTFVITDALGNTDSRSVTEDHVDTTAPAFVGFQREESGWATSAAYTFTVDETQSGIASVTVQMGTEAPITLAPDANGLYSYTATTNGEYTFTVTDAVGNTASTSVAENQVDTTAPAFVDFEREESGWATSATYTFTVTETQSGVASVTLQTGTEAPVTLSPDANGLYSYTITANGVYTVTVTDAVGNTSTHEFTEDQVDTTAPAFVDFEREESGWATSATYTFSLEETQSGVASVTLQIDAETPVALTPDQNGVYSFTLNANCSVVVTVVDTMGNTNTHSVTEDHIDTTAPAFVDFQRVESGWATSATYTFTVTETQSGVASVTVQMGTEAPVALTPDADGLYSFNTNINGEYTFTVVDAMGNTNTYTITEDHVDTTTPVIEGFQRVESGWATSATFTFTVTETQSGVAAVTVRLDGGSPVTLTPDADGLYRYTATVNGDYSFTVEDAVGNTISAFFYEDHVDTTAPVIMDLLRAESGWATKATYSFTVIETQSGIQSVTVTIGEEEPKVLTADENGVYTFVLPANAEFIVTVTDTVDNTSTASGVEDHVDTTAPEIGIPIRNDVSWLYSAGYTFTVADPASGMASVTVTPKNGEPVTLTPNAQGQYSYIAEENNEYTITAIDSVGNTSTKTFTETKVDYTAPAIGYVTRDPDTWSQEADFSFVVTETQSGIASVKVWLGDQEIELTKTENEYRFHSTMNGTYRVEAVDIVGNTTTVLIGEFQIDLQAPVISEIKPQQEWDPETNTVTFKAADDKELVSVTVTDKNGKTFSVTDGEEGAFSVTLDKNGDYTITAIDRAGNKTTAGFTVMHIDTEKPTAPKLESTGKELWVNTDVTITANSTDSQSGVVAYWYSAKNSDFDKNTWTKLTLDGSTGSFTLTAEQDTVYYVVAEDAVGRISDASQIRVAIDKTAPGGHEASFVTAEASGFNRIVAGKYIYNDKVTFFAKASDAASGVVAYQYRIIGVDTEWVDVEADETGFQAIRADLADGIYTVEIRACDLAGNWSDSYTILADGEAVEFVLENTPDETLPAGPAPDVKVQVGTEAYDGSWTAKDVSILVSGSAAISGIESYEYRIDYADPAIKDISWQAVPADGKLTVTKDTNATYYFRAVTYAGNRSKESSTIIRVQKSAPVAATLTPDAATGTNGWYTVLPGYKVVLPEQNSFMAPVHYTIDYSLNGKAFEQIRYDGTNAPAINADGIWTVTITAVDAAGNTSVVVASTAEFKVDTVAPDALTVTLNGSSILTVAEKAQQSWDKVNYSNLAVASDFTIFKNYALTVKASAEGGDSGMAGIYYMTLTDGSKFSTDGEWLPLEEAGVKLAQEQKYCLFFKAVDAAGNITYFSAKSIIVDYATPAEVGTKVANTNRSEYGLYGGDVTVNLSVMDPIMGDVQIFSGIQSVTYKVFCDGEMTQEGQLYPGSGTASETDGRISAWYGSFTIDGEKNNSNHITAEITVTDKAGNTRTATIEDGTVRIDLDAPVVRSSYNRNTASDTYGGVSYFTGSRILTVTVSERNFSEADSYVLVTDTDTGKTVQYDWSGYGSTYTAELVVDADGHYTVEAVIADTAGNSTKSLGFVSGTTAANAFVIDNTAPVIEVSYDNNEVSQKHYFNASRTATVTVTDRNFNPDYITAEIKVVLEDGTERLLELSAWTSDGNTHTATVLCDLEGEYSISVSGSDASGNAATEITYTGEAAQSFVVDTHIDAPIFADVADGSAYAGEIIPKVSAVDKNMDIFTVTLYRTLRNEIAKDVTEEMLSGLEYDSIDNGFSAVLDLFREEQEVDGIYTLVVSVTDKAGNTAESSVTFSVNRLGSVYVYDEALVDLNGTSVQKQETDLIVREYNPSGVEEDSFRLYITVDGTPIADPKYTVEVNAPSGEGSGWYEYIYTISAKNFAADGVYEVVVSTKDLAGNIPENTAAESAIRFSVDTTAPELPSIIGLEEPIYEADSIEVTLSALDNVALESIVVYLNGEEHQRWDAIGSYASEQKFTVPAGLEHLIRIVVTDAAGNVLDTADGTFAPGYAYNEVVTVSTNAFLRFYANKPLFYGTVGGCVAVISALVFFVLGKKRKKNEQV